MMEDFHTLCGFGGRLAGTESERRAREFVAERLKGMPGEFHEARFQFTGRVPIAADVRLADTIDAEDVLEAVALPGSPSIEKTRLRLVDVGLGTEDDFRAASEQLRGSAVLVRHEYPFSTNHVHRRKKYLWAKEYGCSAFIIANNIPGIGPVSGGCGSKSSGDIPGVGVSYEAGLALASATGRGVAHVSISVSSQELSWDTANLVLDIPGEGNDYILIGAHLDGHPLAHSAIDNATGVASSIAITEAFGRCITGTPYGLRLAIFNAEEWGLEGSRQYLDGIVEQSGTLPKLAIILDSITGFPRLSALTGGNLAVEQFMHRHIERNRVAIDIIRPVLANSDHYNFQRRGIPSLRLIAGYGNPSSLTRFLLTAADTEGLVESAELKAATLTAADLVFSACTEWT